MLRLPGGSLGQRGAPGVGLARNKIFAPFPAQLGRGIRTSLAESLRHTSLAAKSLTDPWRTLGVSKNADEKEIKRAHRKLVLQHHPDISKEDAEAEARFLAIQEAYEIIMGRRRGKESDSSPNGNSWDFHDWYWRFSMSKRWGRSKSSSRAGATNPFASATPPPGRQWKTQLEGLRHKAAAKRAKRRPAPASSSSSAGPGHNQQGRAKPAWSSMTKNQSGSPQKPEAQGHTEQLGSRGSIQSAASGTAAHQQSVPEGASPVEASPRLNNSVAAAGLGSTGFHQPEKAAPADGGKHAHVAARTPHGCQRGHTGTSESPRHHAQQDEGSVASQQQSSGLRHSFKIDWSFLQQTEEQLTRALREAETGSERGWSAHAASRRHPEHKGVHGDLAQHAEQAQRHGFLRHVVGHVQRLRVHSEGRVHSHAVRFVQHASQLGQHLQVRLRSLSASANSVNSHDAQRTQHADLHLEFEETVRKRNHSSLTAGRRPAIPLNGAAGMTPNRIQGLHRHRRTSGKARMPEAAPEGIVSATGGMSSEVGEAGDQTREHQHQQQRRRFVNDGQVKERVSSQLAGLRRRAAIRQELVE